MENKSKVLVLGALIGAATGLFAAVLLQRRAEQNDTDITLSTGDGIKLGMLVFGLLRAVSSLGEDG